MAVATAALGLIAGLLLAVATATQLGAVDPAEPGELAGWIRPSTATITIAARMAWAGRRAAAPGTARPGRRGPR